MVVRNLIVVFAAVLSMMSVSTHADTRIWVEAAKTQHLPEFQQHMEERKWAREASFLARGLAMAACYHASQIKVNGNTPECVQQFLKRNGITSEWVTESEFVARSNGEGWWIPHASVVVTAAPAVAQPVATPISETATATPATPAADIAGLKEQVQQLQAAVSKSSRGDEQVVELQRAIESLAAKLATAEKTLGSNLTAMQQVQKGHAAKLASAEEALESLPTLQQVQQDLRIGLANLERGELTEALIKSIGQQVKAAEDRLTGKLLALKADSALGYDLVAKWSPEAASKYAEHSTAIYAAVIAMAFGLGLILFSVLNGRQKKTTAMVKNHDRVLHNHDRLLHDKDDGVLARLGVVEMGLLEVRRETSALQAAVVDSATLAEETHEVVMAQQDPVIFDDKNPGLEELRSLGGGDSNAVEWTGSNGGEQFIVKIWRDSETPEGQVKTDMWRRRKPKGQVKTNQKDDLAGPVALTRLKMRIQTAVIDRRVNFIKVVGKKKAA